jgi:DNA replication ATP-dependent helicase Dna2
MVLGSLLHVLFQTAISHKKYLKSDLNQLLIEFLKKKQIIAQLYNAGLDEQHVLRETGIYLESIETWLKENLAFLNLKTTQNSKNFQINDICDIEESIWSPKYGVKGKLDLTMKTNVKLGAFRTLSSSLSIKNNFKKEQNSSAAVNSNLNSIHSHIIPVELKSGKTTFSAEHEGQVQLYSLLNYEKRSQSDFGLLLYLKDMSMKFIKVNQVSLRGLIQLRNELTQFIHMNSLPEFKNEERVCSKCPLIVPCSLLGQEEGKLSEIYKKAISHLSDSHRQYFFKWYKMLEFEFKDEKQFDSGSLIWWRGLDDLESEGRTVANLKLDNFKTNSSEYSGEGFFLFDFVKELSCSDFKTSLKENDMILLSSLSENLIGLAQGFIRSISKNNSSKSLKLQLLVDKNLSSDLKYKTHLFRIDKINFRSSINLNYTNLARLMSESKTTKCSRLRQFIIDKELPQFDKVLPKQHIIDNKSIFRRLNQSQQAAIIKVKYRLMMTSFFILI